ncbi:17478_t:CDS:2 [Racocetra persica]|uniref:17478_t:CDS:1 n=1 Tax=Racocetra persica TaxID=160502 RepID=A0ACA9K8G9_9GLOM|nr:17478_t:CDS:2 [Racocetra persica]
MISYWTTTSWIENIHLSYLKESLNNEDISQKAIKLVKKTTQKFSNSTVGLALKRYTIWYKEASVDLIQYSITNISNFLVKMSDEGLLYNTIALYHSAISEVYDLIDSLRVGYHPSIAKIILSIYKNNSSPPPPEDAINIILVLEYITLLDTNKEMLMINLLRKTAFLLAITSATRHSNL